MVTTEKTGQPQRKKHWPSAEWSRSFPHNKTAEGNHLKKPRPTWNRPRHPSSRNISINNSEDIPPPRRMHHRVTDLAVLKLYHCNNVTIIRRPDNTIQYILSVIYTLLNVFKAVYRFSVQTTEIIYCVSFYVDLPFSQNCQVIS